jgi:hypothetical protein
MVQRTEQTKEKFKQDFITKAKKVHGDSYTYDLVSYCDGDPNVKITCPTHGVFEQRPSNHVNKQSGCPTCSGLKKLSTETFIVKAKKIHGDRFNYDLVDYKNSRTKIKITCPTHGVFEQVPASHLQNIGCLVCSGKHHRTTDEFVLESKLVHGHKFDYTLVEYVSTGLKVDIICGGHGKFKQTPHNHLQGQGCPVCQSSKGELSVSKFLDDNNIYYKREYSFPNCTHKRLLRFDFYLPDKNICIEYDGIWHEIPHPKDYDGNGFKGTKIRDKIKDKYCVDNSIRLIRINYDENITDHLNPLTM